MLKFKTEVEVTEHLESAIKWAMRQHAHEGDQSNRHTNVNNVQQGNLVRQVMTDVEQ